MYLSSMKKETKKTKKVFASILFLSLFCLSLIFTTFAGPGELYQKKLENQSLDKNNDSEEVKFGKLVQYIEEIMPVRVYAAKIRIKY